MQYRQQRELWRLWPVLCLHIWHIVLRDFKVQHHVVQSPQQRKLSQAKDAKSKPLGVLTGASVS